MTEFRTHNTGSFTDVLVKSGRFSCLNVIDMDFETYIRRTIDLQPPSSKETTSSSKGKITNNSAGHPGAETPSPQTFQEKSHIAEKGFLAGVVNQDALNFSGDNTPEY